MSSVLIHKLPSTHRSQWIVMNIMLDTFHTNAPCLWQYNVRPAMCRHCLPSLSLNGGENERKHSVVNLSYFNCTPRPMQARFTGYRYYDCPFTFAAKLILMKRCEGRAFEFFRSSDITDQSVNDSLASDIHLALRRSDSKHWRITYCAQTKGEMWFFWAIGFR